MRTRSELSSLQSASVHTSPTRPLARQAIAGARQKEGAMAQLFGRFFWGEPSHRRIAWYGAIAGVLLLALAVEVATIGKGQPLFTLGLIFVGLAEFGWAAELLPRGSATLAGWLRAARWICALVGAVLGILALVWGIAPTWWFGGAVALGGVLLALEMAPNGPANRP
jgi:hypothetical protein